MVFDPSARSLDLLHEQLSLPMRAALIDTFGAKEQTPKVVRSRRLDVYSPGDPWLVKIPPEPGKPPGPTYRLEKDMVRSIAWCN